MRSTVARQLDRFVFVKNGYSFVVHLVPFAIAALLLLILSVPQNDTLLRLVGVFEKPNARWLPAGVLTVVSVAMYLASMRVQIARFYLRSVGLCHKVIATALLYGGLCTAMGYAVLISAGADAAPLMSKLCACALLALLSLNGIGWPLSRDWVKALGVRCPDYVDAQGCAARLVDCVEVVRQKERAEPKDADAVKRYADELRGKIEGNLAAEPEWARAALRQVVNELESFSTCINERFPAGDRHAVEDFAAACNYEKPSQYAAFHARLKALSVWWPRLGKPVPGRGAVV